MLFAVYSPSLTPSIFTGLVSINIIGSVNSSGSVNLIGYWSGGSDSFK